MSTDLATDSLRIGDRTFSSRLLLGTGKFASNAIMRDACAASATGLVTVALKRASLTGPDAFADILDYLEDEKYLILPNTAGAMDAEEAIRIARLSAAAGSANRLELVIHPGRKDLRPDPIASLRGAGVLVADGWTVLPYINADPVLAARLQDVGCATVMPLGSPIGTNRGLETAAQLRIIIEQARVPVVIDAGIGSPSHAAAAMEMGADAVLVNTAIAIAADPVRMARAFAAAVEAGRAAYEIGLGMARDRAVPTSPLTTFLS